MVTQTPRLYRLIGVAALTAVLLMPALRAAAGSPGVPPALQGAIVRTLANEAGPADAIRKDGCGTLKTQHLTACFGKGGVRFSGKDAPPVSLHLAAYGRGKALTMVKPMIPTIQGNRASYAHGSVSEWWRALPAGFEQGFTVAKRPAGEGAFTLALADDRSATPKGSGVTWGALRYGDLVVTDAAGHIVPSRLTTKGGKILIAVNDSHAVYPLTVDPLVWVQQQKLTAGDGGANEFFGTSVALDGTTALVGAPSGGAAYVFTESYGTWTQTQKLSASGSSGFGYSVALEGATAIIGASSTTVGENFHQGAAYVFDDSSGTWTQTQELLASDGGAGDDFGTSVALDGTTALAGAPDATVGGNAGQGAAYLFDDSSGTWTQTQKLTAGDGAANDNFGYSVALDGTTALAGAPGATVGGNAGQGAAYLFDEAGGTWTQTQKLTASDGAANNDFGRAVALSGTTALVGAYQAAIGGNNFQGAAYVFDKSGGTWTQTQKLTAGDGAANDFFGDSVALDGTTALVGSPLAAVGGNAKQGAAYVFGESGGTWTQTAKLTASDGTANDNFGYSVALDGTAAVIGASAATVGGNPYQGAAYVYTATCPQGYGEHDGSLNAGGLYGSPPYQAPPGLENGILGGPGGFQLYLLYSNGTAQHLYRIAGNEIHQYGPAGTYRWGVKTGSIGGAYVLCTLHP